MSKDALQQFQTDVHKLAQSKGWWDEERSFLTLLGLIISEFGELIEAFRKPDTSDKIPEFMNYEEEIADIFIRTFDAAEHFNFNIVESLYQLALVDINDTDHLLGTTYETRLVNIVNFLILNAPLNSSLNGYLEDKNEIEICTTGILGMGQLTGLTAGAENLILSTPLACLLYLCSRFSIDLGNVLLKKHEYNQNRSHRHGDKLY